jgi:hypothetical protein
MSVSLSGSRLHASFITKQEHIATVKRQLAAVAAPSGRLFSLDLAPSGRLEIPISTVSLDRNFDAYVNVNFKGGDASAPITAVVDTGNSTLILPDWGTLSSLQNFATDYRVLISDTTEPWGCPAAIVEGPIEIPLATGNVYTILNCIFFVCKGPNASGDRTANFGIGCVSPWPVSSGVMMKSPLSYDPAYPITELCFASKSAIFSTATEPTVKSDSAINLYGSLPTGYQTFSIISGLEWMALVPKSLKIAATETRWPNASGHPIAMIDCGGGPVYLSDPDGYLYSQAWPDQVPLPEWANTGSVSCQAVKDDLQFVLGDAKGDFTISISEGSLPPATQNLTLVICQTCQYMMGEYGLNIGGISALFNRIALDYSRGQVAFKPV